MSDIKVQCESAKCKGRRPPVFFEVGECYVDGHGIPTYMLSCRVCGGTSAVQDVPDSALEHDAVVAPGGTDDDFGLLPPAIPVDDDFELNAVHDDVLKPDGKAEAEFYEQRANELDR